MKDTPIHKNRSSRFFDVAIPVLAVCFIMLLAASPSLSKPLIMDEMEFPAVARAIRQTGLPVYYRGDLFPDNVGLWHPPLYITAYALWQSVVGESIATDRLFGLFAAWCAIITIGIFVARRWSWSNGDRQGTVQKALALFLGLCIAGTSPLLIQGSMLPDIDTQVLPLATVVFFLLMFELRRRGGRPIIYWAVFIVAMIVLLFAKLTTPVLLVPAFMVFEIVSELSSKQNALRARLYKRSMHTTTNTSRSYRVLSFSFSIDWRRLGVRTILPLAAGMCSLALMAVLWFTVAQLWGVDFSIPFKWLAVSTNNPANFGATPADVIRVIIQRIPQHFTYFAQWIGFPALFLMLLMILREVAGPSDGLLARQERMAIQTFLMLLTIMYLILHPAPYHFPKYYPPLMLPLSLLIIDWLFALQKQKRFRLVAVMLVSEIVLYLIYIISSQPAATLDFIHAIQYGWPKMPYFMAWMLWPLVIVSLLNIALRQQKLGTSLVLSSVAVLLGWQIFTAVQQTQVTYSTTYYYGEESLAKVANYLRAHLPDNVIVIAPKDVGALIQDRWHYIELLLDPRPQLERAGVEYFVTRTNDQWGNAIRNSPEISGVVEMKYELFTTIDNFIIMKRKS